ncbi:MAG: hypothetical protein V1918_02000 [Planctomycetota bacterium]
MAWVEISQAAFTMGISERTIRNWIKSGKINARTDNGRRLVEIPEEEPKASSAGPEAFAEGEFFGTGTAEEGAEPLGTQKRLEIALLECGRVKGTLASQERIMETLSGNIAELTAKLQKGQNQNWKLVLLCFVIASLGAIVVLSSGSFYNQKIQKERSDHDQVLSNHEKERYKRELEMQEEKSRLESGFKEEKEAALARQKTALEVEHKEKVQEVRDIYESIQKKLESRAEQDDAALKTLREERDTDRARLVELTRETSTLRDDLAQTTKELAFQKSLVEEFKQIKDKNTRELQDTILELRQRIFDLENPRNNP